MLGYKIGVLAVLTILFPSITLQSFANPIFMEFDQLEYHTGDSLTISGQISDFKMPVIALSIYDPDEKILSANNVEINSDGTFSKILSLDSPFYDKSGEYKVKLNYGKIIQHEFFTILNDNNPEPKIIPPESVDPKILLLSTDKNEYTDNDTVIITGTVSAMDLPTVLIGIYDPFGAPTGFYFGQIDSNLRFSTNFLAKAGVNFKTDGAYFIKAHYGETEETTIFNFYKEIDPIFFDDKVILDNDLKENKISSENKSVIKNDGKEKITTKKNIEKNNSEIKPIKINDAKNTNTNVVESKIQIKKDDNLSIEDIELGKLLNQINLECDQSKLTDVISYYDGMGPALYRLCKFDKSLIFFDNSLIQDPNNVEILTNKGSALGKLGRFSESIAYYDQAIEINLNFIPAINNKANALANMGKYHESISLYADAIEKNPDFQTARKNLRLVSSELLLENKTLSVVQEFPSPQITSYNVSEIENTPKHQSAIISKPQTEKHSDFFEEINLVFSSLRSLLRFLN